MKQIKIKTEQGKYYWCIEWETSRTSWEQITKGMYDQINKFYKQDKIVLIKATKKQDAEQKKRVDAAASN